MFRILATKGRRRGRPDNFRLLFLKCLICVSNVFRLNVESTTFVHLSWSFLFICL